MIWRSGTFASESKVIADAMTEWLVYICESSAPRDISFIMSHSLLTPNGLFSYQTVSYFVTLGFGYWKNAVQDGFSFAAKKL